MARTYLVTSTGVTATVSATVAAAASALVDGADYIFASSTACWIRQGTSKLVTCVAKASMADTDFMTITTPTSTKVYEFDTAGDGVTAGRVQVNISTDTTAATVAARLKTAINANQTDLTVTDPANGTLVVDLPDSTGLTISENVANAGFTIGTGTMQATAATGSSYTPANTPMLLSGVGGGQLGVIRDAADGKSTTIRVKVI